MNITEKEVQERMDKYTKQPDLRETSKFSRLIKSRKKPRKTQRPELPKAGKVTG